MSTSFRISSVVLAATLLAGACQSGVATTTPTAMPTLAPHGGGNEGGMQPATRACLPSP